MNTFQQQYAEMRKQKEQTLLQHALEDGEFRSALMANPRETISTELGINIPSDADVRIIEEPANSFYVVLPTNVAEGDELSDELLEAVAGGWWVELLWTSVCFGGGDGPAPSTSPPKVEVA